MIFNSLKSRIIFSITGIILSAFTIIIFFFGQKAKNELAKAIEGNALNMLSATKNHVESQYNSIIYHKNVMLSRRKAELKQDVELVVEVISSYWLEYKNGTISEEEAKQKAFKFVKNLRYDNGVGYFWIINTERPLPLLLLHPIMMSLQNTYLKDKKFYCALNKKENLTKAMVDVCLKDGEGYVDYRREKPTSKGLTKPQPKISYVKLFKKWEWIIGTGIYINDIEKDVKNSIDAVVKDLNKTIIKQRIGKNGYFFIFDEKGNMLVHPNIRGKDFKNMINPVTKNLISEELKKAAFSEKKFVEYLWDKPGHEGEFKFLKKSFMTYYEPLKWYIGSSIYKEDFEKGIANLTQTILILSGIFLIISLIISLFVTRSITTPLKKLILSISKTDSNGIPENIIPKTEIKEIEMLRATINNMINTISKSRQELKKERDFSMNVIHDAPYIICSLNHDSQITFINPAGEKITGYSKEEILDKNWWDLFYPKEEHIQVEKLFEEFSKGDVEDYEMSLTCKNGNKKFVLWNSFTRKKENNIIQIIGIGKDITKQKLAEEEAIKAEQHAAVHEKQALVGQIAGKIAHDFNNILSIIMGNAELSLIKCKSPETKETLELIFKQTLRGKELTKNLISFSLDQEPKQELFNINDKINLVLKLLKKDLKEIEVIMINKPGIPELLADPGMIEHALVNLIQNSIHATSMIEHPKITIKTYALNNNIYFEIEDNGCGIPQQHIDNIYDSSFTLKGYKDETGLYKNDINGSGYGMANVKKYIEQHNGSISVESELGKGTKFIINIPIIEKPLTNQTSFTNNKDIIHSNKRILLIEDEMSISDIQYKVLTQKPFNHIVDIANNGRNAIDLFNQNKYDFISLDYILPGKYNGMDIYHYIRKKNKEIPILFLSGNIEFLESIQELQQKDNNVSHQSKPCQNKDYIDKIY